MGEIRFLHETVDVLEEVEKQHILRVIDHCQGRMSEAARQRVLTDFTVEKTARETIAVYRDLLGPADVALSP